MTLSGTCISKALHLARMKKLLRASFSELMPWKSLGSVLVISMASAVPSIILNAKLEVPSLVLLPVSGMAYMATYSCLVLALGLLTEEEKAVMKRSLYVWNRRSAESR